MEKDQKKKEYEKPKVTRIKLDAKCAVLGFCKNGLSSGPAGIGCKDVFSAPCNSQGS
jgi:hypothetical protein